MGSSISLEVFLSFSSLDIREANSVRLIHLLSFVTAMCPATFSRKHWHFSWFQQCSFFSILQNYCRFFCIVALITSCLSFLMNFLHGRNIGPSLLNFLNGPSTDPSLLNITHSLKENNIYSKAGFIETTESPIQGTVPSPFTVSKASAILREIILPYNRDIQAINYALLFWVSSVALFRLPFICFTSQPLYSNISSQASRNASLCMNSSFFRSH